MITAKGKIFLITSTSAKLGRLIRHKGILFKYDRNLYVVHRTIKGVEIITYKDFLSTRQVLHYRSYMLKNEVNIEELVRRHRYNRYKLIYNNCETFANRFVDEYSTKRRHHYSEQVLYWVYAVLILLLMLTFALITGTGLVTTIIALVVTLTFLAFISSNYDYVK